MKFLCIFFTIICCTSNKAHGQSDKYISFQGNISFGFSRPLNNPTKFPIGYSDAQLFPMNQSPNLGHHYSLSVLYSLSNKFSIGLHAYVSNYSFVETGDELSFWTNQLSPYSIERSFKMYGFGALSGYTIFSNKIEKLQAYVGVNYGEFISTETIFIFREDYNRNKVLASVSIEYGRLIANDFYLICGVNSTIGLNNFYENIQYKPISYGITVGLEKRINIK